MGYGLFTNMGFLDSCGSSDSNHHTWSFEIARYGLLHSAPISYVAEGGANDV